MIDIILVSVNYLETFSMSKMSYFLYMRVDCVNMETYSNPESLDNVDWSTLKNILGGYCSGVNMQTEHNSTKKRQLISTLSQTMAQRNGNTAEDIQDWLSSIWKQCEDLEVVMSVHITQQRSRTVHFKIFEYQGKTYDVRNVIKAIGRLSEVLWNQSKQEIDLSTLMKTVYGHEPPSPFPRCAEVIIQFFNEINSMPKTVREDIEENVNNYRTTHNFGSSFAFY